jgi:hypothetical protein
MEAVMAIRRYGPGKFHTLLDSFAYELTLDGVDEEESYGEGGGWYGLVWLEDGDRTRIREIAGDDLTEDEETLLDDTVAIIFFERSDGIVETDWFNDEEEAEEQWEDIRAEFEEEEAD